MIYSTHQPSVFHNIKLKVGCLVQQLPCRIFWGIERLDSQRRSVKFSAKSENKKKDLDRRKKTNCTEKKRKQSLYYWIKQSSTKLHYLYVFNSSYYKKMKSKQTLACMLDFKMHWQFSNSELVYKNWFSLACAGVNSEFNSESAVSPILPPGVGIRYGYANNFYYNTIID